ncbi:MAG: response regulator [Ignavibacteria bacterium]
MEQRGNPTRVLLVDDSVAVLWGLAKLIQGEYPRMTVIGAVASADDALVYCDLEPHVTLLDIDLRGASSLGFIPEIRARSRGQVLVFSGVRDVRVHGRALALGAAAVIGKDAPGAMVLRAIERARDSGAGSFVPAR